MNELLAVLLAVAVFGLVWYAGQEWLWRLAEREYDRALAQRREWLATRLHDEGAGL